MLDLLCKSTPSYNCKKLLGIFYRYFHNNEIANVFNFFNNPKQMLIFNILGKVDYK